MQYILAIDQGTTSSRAVVFDRQGNIKSLAQQEFRQIFPMPGHVEHDPIEIWETQLEVARQAIEKGGLKARNIAAIGISNQRETTVIWDRATGKPIYNAIVWQDRRTATICRQLQQAGHEPLFRKKTGLLLDPYFSGTKIQWILNNVKTAREKADKGELAFGTIDSWLLWNLTGGQKHITDATNASRTLLYDIHRGCWDDELLEILDIPASILPEVRSSSEVYAMTAKDLFSEPIPIAGIAGDQQAALFGQRCTRLGMVKNTYGTGCFMLLNTGNEAVMSKNRLLTTIAWKIGDKVEYALEGSVFVAGAVVQWLRDGLKLIKDASDIEALAASVSDNGGVYFVPAFAGLGAPHWDPHAKGTILGITRGTTAGHLARAALEGIAYQVADVLEAMESDSGASIETLRVDGGASEDRLLMQFQADILGVSIAKPRINEITALGAAYLAGLAVGYWKDQSDIDTLWSAEKEFKPAMSDSQVEMLRSSWCKAIEGSKGLYA